MQQMRFSWAYQLSAGLNEEQNSNASRFADEKELQIVSNYLHFKFALLINYES